MKKLFIILALLLANTMFALPLVKVDGEAEVSNKYVWRGVEFDDSYVFQPWIGVTALGAEAYIWNNIALDPGKGRDKFNETDFVVSYTQSMGLFDIKPIFSYYQLHEEDAKDTAEFGMEFSVSVLWFKAYTSHSLNMIEYTGDYYGNIGAKFEFNLLPMIDLEADANIGWFKGGDKNNFLGTGKDSFTMNSMNLSAQVKFSPVPLFYIGAYGAMTQKLGDFADFAEAAKEDKTIIYGGISLGFSL